VQVPNNNNPNVYIDALLFDIASTIARVNGGLASSIRRYLTLTLDTAPAVRRLLQQTQTMQATLSIHDDINTVTSADALSVASSVSDAIANETLNTSASRAAGVTVPRQSAQVEGVEKSSSSSSLSDGAIAGIVIGSVVGAVLLAVLAFMFCSSRRDKESGVSRTRQSEEDGSHDDVREHDDHNESHGDDEVELQTV